VNQDGSGLRKLWDDGDDISFALRPDGARLAVVSSSGGQADLHLLDANTGAAEEAIDLPSAMSVRGWSPDGQWIALDQGSPSLRTLAYSVVTAMIQPIALKQARFHGWSADGAGIYVRQYEPSVLIRLSLPGLQPEQLHGGQDYLPIEPSPDGSRVAYGTLDYGARGGPSTYTVSTTAADGSLGRDLVSYDDEPALSGGHDIAWSPDGRRLAFGRLGTFDGLTRGAGVYVIDGDGGEAVQLTFPDEGVEGEIMWAHDGEYVLVVRAICTSCDGSGWKVVLAAADGSGEIDLPGTEGFTIADAAWSPDGSHFAYSGDALYVSSADGSQVVRVVEQTGASYGSLVWSSDGERIYFLRAGALSVTYAVHPNGTGLEVVSGSVAPDGQTDVYSPAEGEVILRSGGQGVAQFALDYVFESAWSPDSERLAVASRGGGGVRNHLEVLSLDGSRSRLATHGYIGRPRWSPAGTHIAYAGDGALWVAPVDGGSPQRLADDISGGIDWSPDGAEVAYGRDDGSVSFARLDGPPRKSVPIGVNRYFPLDVRWSPDGERVALATDEELLVLELDTGALEPVHRGNILGFAWTADSARLAFGVSDYADPPKPRGVFLVDVEEGSRMQLTEAIGPPHEVAGSLADGRILFVSRYGP
jgi:Tol biopolymer transport system component